MAGSLLDVTRDVYGPPVAGKGLSLAYDNTDKTLALEANAVYILFATTDVFLGGADTTTAANQSIYLPGGVQYAMATGAAYTLHATRVAVSGTLYAGKVLEP